MLPAELTSRRQWLTWNLIGGTKVPVTPYGTVFKVNDTSTFADFTAVEKLDRIAFVITEDDPFYGIDLDDCILEDGSLTEPARMIISMLGPLSYCEVSPSGNGIKLISIGKKPEGMRCVYHLAGQRLEIYDHSRFWTITKQVFSGHSQITDSQKSLDLLHSILGSQEPKPLPPSPKVLLKPIGDSDLHRRASDYLSRIPLPSKGNINDTLFSAAGHLHSLVDELNQKLPDETILQMLLAWCGHVDPEITESYVAARVRTSKSCGTPPAPKPPQEPIYQPVDISGVEEWIASQEQTEDDETYIESLVPEKGLIREIYDYYCATAFYRSSLMGMATAMSLVETLFGRRVQSDNGCRTNDFNVVLAATGNGKENCERTISRILTAADATNLIMPSGVQSGNGLLAALAAEPCSIWIKDEFGIYLEGVFGKRKQPIEQQVGRLLLELYTKSDSRYSGNAHAAGKKNEIEQPHLVLLGLSTHGSLAQNIDFTQVESGTMNRISWWIVTERPKLQDHIRIVDPPDYLVHRVARWKNFTPESSTIPPIQSPEVIHFAADARARWELHNRQIQAKQEQESSLRAALWSRTAHRTLKFALCSVCSRISGPEELNPFERPPLIELRDVEWAIKLSNWISRSAVDFALTATADKGQQRAELAILDFVGKTTEPVKLRLIQMNRKIQKNELVAAAKKLESEGKIEVTRKGYGQKEQITVRRKVVAC